MKGPKRHELKRYFDPEQCCNCGPNTVVPPSELKLVPILPPEDGGTYNLENWAIMCPKCREVTLDGSDEDYDTTDRPPKSERQEVIKLDNETCVACGQKGEGQHGELHVHHLRPLGRGGRNRKSNMVTMDEKCHNMLTNRQKMDFYDQINVGRAQDLLRRAGNELQESEMFRDWMLSEHPPIEAVEVYREQYHRLDSLIERHQEMQFPIVEMRPFIDYLKNLKRMKELKYMNAAYYYRQKARKEGKPIPEQVPEMTP